jgi:exopolysaccharide biosynthesis polyprenyl glycosylphosphotransferase
VRCTRAVRPVNRIESLRAAEWSDAVVVVDARAERWLGPLASALLVLGDLLLITAAFVIAYWFRFIAPGDEASGLALESYVRMGATVAALAIVVLVLHGFYDASRPRTWAATLQTVVSGVSTGLVVSVAASFFIGEQGFSRLWFGAGWCVAVALMFVWRAAASRAYVAVRAAVVPRRRMVVVGANPLGRELAGELSGRYDILGYVDNGSDLAGATEPPLLGPIAQLEGLVQQYAVDELVVALPENRREQIMQIIARGFSRRVEVKLVPGLEELLPHRVQVSRLGARSFISFAPAAPVGWSKRALDLALASIALLLTLPLLACIAIAIKLDSQGPVFFRQERLGKDAEPFQMLKFRSMVKGADRLIDSLIARNEQIGPLFKIRRDPRLTRVGAVLRRLSLDELPQLFNVLRGDMSLVGPRPPLPAETAKYESWQLGRLRARPGMTGLWQVSGRSEVPFHDMVRLDLHYIRNWSLQLDIEIMLRTIPAVVSNRGAY